MRQIIVLFQKLVLLLFADVHGTLPKCHPFATRENPTDHFCSGYVLKWVRMEQGAVQRFRSSSTTLAAASCISGSACE